MKPNRLRRIPNRYYGWLYILPALLLVVLLIGYPLLRTFKMSFFDNVLTRANPAETFVGMQNYGKVFSDPNMPSILLNTVGFVLLATGGAFIVGFGLALLVNALSPRLKAFFGSFFLIPYIVPSIVLTMLWMWLFNPTYGIVNHLLSLFGMVSGDLPWFTNALRSPIALLLLYIYKSAPFHMLMIFAALQTINQDLYEAVEVDGGHVLHKFWYVTVPSIQRVLVVLVSLSAMHCMNFFSPIWLLSEGGPNVATTTISVWLYSTAFRKYDFGVASSISILWVLLVGLVFGSILIISRGVEHFAAGRRHR